MAAILKSRLIAAAMVDCFTAKLEMTQEVINNYLKSRGYDLSEDDFKQFWAIAQVEAMQILRERQKNGSN